MNKQGRPINLGDKIFARVTRNGQTIYNFVSEKITSMTQLISEVRFAMKDVQGLVMIHIRNFHQGWGEERPLMLYPQEVRNQGYFKAEKSQEVTATPSRMMLFPWETH